MQRVLVISDNPRPLAALQQALVRAGLTVTVAAATEADLDRSLSGYPPDVCALDLAHSRLTPARLRHHLSRAYDLSSVPTLLLLAEEHLELLAANPPGDDFLMQPYRPAEFVARVRLLLWHTHRTDPSHLIMIGDLVIDQSTYQVRVGGERLELTYKEYELLRFLASHRGKVFTREALLSHVWGYDYYGGVRTVDVHVRRVRAKLGSPADALLETVRNVGYRFAEPAEPEPA